MAALAREAVSRLNVELMSASDRALAVTAAFGDSNLVVQVNVDAAIAFGAAAGLQVYAFDIE
jgi:hypothetical protein